jgi:NAD(P)-dependent dehydrogenase (short-subunit alcohol dehydrogenase family)
MYRDLFDLSGKSAVVTGGGGILGQHFCAGLVEFGAQVAVLDKDGSAAQRVVDEIDGAGSGRAFAIACDVSDAKSVADTVEKMASDVGRIDILLNNAATKTDDPAFFFAAFEDYEPDVWREIMGVNIDAMFLMAQAVGRLMKKDGLGGSIIQTSSIYGIAGPDQRIYEGSNYLGMEINTPAVYSTSKAAVIGLTRHLATYWGSDGIRVNSITPGGVESGQNDVFSKRYSERVPLRRMAQAHEMVGAILYLASDASSYVTGQNIVVDGGLSAW